MGLGDEYELDTVEEETGNREGYEEEIDSFAAYRLKLDTGKDRLLEQQRQDLYDFLEETEDGEIEVPEKYKTIIGPVGAGRTRRNSSTAEHEMSEKHRIHTPKDRTKSLRKRLTDTEERDITFRGHYHTPGWYRG